MKTQKSRIILFPALIVSLAVVLAACRQQPVVTPAVPSPAVTSSATSESLLLATPTGGAATAVATQAVASKAPSATPPSPAVTGTQAAGRATPEPVPGVEMHNITPAGGLDLVAASGIHWVRRNALPWAKVEPQKSNRDWQAVAGLEAELQNASRSNLEVILIIRDTPAWARKLPGVACGPVSEAELGSFAAFLHDMVARYSQPPYNVRYFELGNEPDVAPGSVPNDSVFGCWGDAQKADFGGAYYAQMLKAAYPQIKAANPEAQVLVGGLLLDCDPDNPPASSSGARRDCTGSLFLDGILKAGGGDYFDGVSFHAYDYSAGVLGEYGNPGWSGSSASTGPALILKAAYLKQVLVANGHPEKYLVNTEVALICAGSKAACEGEDFEQSKAYYAAQANAAALAAGVRANIWYSITGWRYSGLVDQKMEPLPALEAEKVSAEMLGGAVSAGAVTEIPNVKGFAFQRGETRLWVLWSLDGQPHALALPSPPSRVVGVYGEAHAANQVDYEPVYIEWGP